MVEKEVGIDKFNDLTGSHPLIKIYLSKNANPEKVLKMLYKETSLQYHYAINMTMLEDGKYPRIFNWKTALQSYLDHQEEVYRRGFEYDLNKISARLHIVEGILIAIARIEEVINTIKKSSSSVAAREALKKEFILSDAQAKAILEIKLARLAHLEVEKYEKEWEELLKEKERIEKILSSEELFKKEIEKDLKAVALKYGDERRTQILNLSTDENDAPIEQKNIIVHLTNEGNLYTFESSTLMVQRRGGRGVKVKMDKNEYIVDTINTNNIVTCLAFSNKGKVYTFSLNDLPVGERINLSEFFTLDGEEKITKLVPYNKIDKNNYMLFITKNGMVKKTSLEEYKVKKSNGVIALKLKENDELVNILLVSSNNIWILTKNSNFVMINTDQINDTGRATSGVIGIKLSNDDEVVDGKIIYDNTKELVTISNKGMVKRIDISNFTLANRATKGSIIQKLKENDKMSGFCTRINEKDIIAISTKAIIRIPINEVQLLNKTAQGVLVKKIAENEKITEVFCEG